MDTREKPSAKQIVHAPSRGLAVRSAAIVARGLRDLTRDSNWLVQRVFTGRSPSLSISPGGRVSAISSWVRQGTEQLAVYDIERDIRYNSAGVMLALPGETPSARLGLPAAFAWSPTGRLLVAAWEAWPAELQAFDLQSKLFVGGFGKYSALPSSLAFSDNGKYFAASSRNSEAAVSLWIVGEEPQGEEPFTDSPAKRVPLTDVVPLLGRAEPAPAGAGGDAPASDETGAIGFGRLAFNPARDILAVVVETEGEWADDAIVLFEVPGLVARRAFMAQGHITDLSWNFDGSQLIFCSAGQAYRMSAGTPEAIALPFGAELCACHPHLPLCLCFSSWLKNSAKGRVFLADLSRLATFDEYAATGIVDLRWRLDGSKAYAVTSEGLAYIYEPPLL